MYTKGSHHIKVYDYVATTYLVCTVGRPSSLRRTDVARANLYLSTSSCLPQSVSAAIAFSFLSS